MLKRISLILVICALIAASMMLAGCESDTPEADDVNVNGDGTNIGNEYVPEYDSEILIEAEDAASEYDGEAPAETDEDEDEMEDAESEYDEEAIVEEEDTADEYEAPVAAQ